MLPGTSKETSRRQRVVPVFQSTLQSRHLPKAFLLNWDVTQCLPVKGHCRSEGSLSLLRRPARSGWYTELSMLHRLKLKYRHIIYWNKHITRHTAWIERIGNHKEGWHCILLSDKHATLAYCNCHNSLQWLQNNKLYSVITFLKYFFIMLVYHLLMASNSRSMRWKVFH
jgi:hypothetical protein